ncbi:MAG: hypothetical protein L0L17_06000 [Yaniella sp.]|nr:hypothetical protein [Yaniella sp.]
MIDAILYVQDYAGLAQHLADYHPELLAKDEHDQIAQPPVVTGFARTPATTNGNALMVYARLRENEAEQCRGMEGVEVLAESPFNGVGTGDAVYQQILDNPEKLTKYKSVHDTEPYDVADDELGNYTVTPPFKFGIIAGA